MKFEPLTVKSLNRMASHCHADQLEISRHTNCPSDHWHNRAAPLLAADTNTELTMLNVGANKGYNLVEWMQRYTDAPHSNADWHKLMMRQADPPCALQCCGVCIVCRRQRATQAARARLRLHAFELQPSNERLLRQLVALSGVIASRYLHWATRQFGAQDASVKRMQQVLALITPEGATQV